MFGELATLGTAAIGGLTSYFGGQAANAANAHQAKLNREFQERMSNTAHQREVKDLRLAGLNPILSGTGGAGASQPSGNVAVMQDTITPAVSSAMSLIRTMADAQKTMAETSNLSTAKELMSEQANQAYSASWLNDQLTSKAFNDTVTAYHVGINEAFKARVQKELFENPKMGDIIRSNATLENAFKKADTDIIKREAQKMRYYSSMDKEDYGKFLMFIERIISGYKGRH